MPSPSVALRCRRSLATMIVAAAISSCALGERPSFDTDPFAPGLPSGSAAVDAVLSLLDSQPVGPLTATYQVVTALSGSNAPPATLVISLPQWSLTVGNVRYVRDFNATPSERTCQLDTGTCEDGIVAQYLSDSFQSHEFANAAAARRLRVDAASSVGTPIAEVLTIGGRSAQCVTVPQASGSPRYCALDTGLLAELSDSDLTITLLTIDSSADPNAFVTAAQ